MREDDRQTPKIFLVEGRIQRAFQKGGTATLLEENVRRIQTYVKERHGSYHQSLREYDTLTEADWKAIEARIEQF